MFSGLKEKGAGLSEVLKNKFKKLKNKPFFFFFDVHGVAFIHLKKIYKFFFKFK
jgi:hypothetical protein